MLAVPDRFAGTTSLCLQGIGEGGILSGLPVNLFAVIEVVGERGVDIRQRQLRELFDNIVRRLPLALVPRDDVLHADARPSDAGLAPTDPWGHVDVICNTSLPCSNRHDRRF